MVAPQQQPKTNTERVLSDYANRQVNGEAMSALSAKRETAIESAKLAGVVPWSVWNFNPVSVFIELLGKKLSIPAGTGGLGIKQSINWRSKERTASSFVFREPKGFSKPTGADFVGDPNAPRVTREWQLVQPIEQVRAFEYEYNGRVGGIGGVLVFQGDGHEVRGNTDKVINIPSVKRAKNGTLIYHPQQVSLAEKLDEIFTRQKEYCFAQLRQAQAWSDDLDPDMKKSVQNGPEGFKAWGQFAIDRGWQDQGRLRWMVPDDADGGCIKCGQTRTSGTAFFCSCGHPYNPFEAFMAGMKVDLDVLATLPADQLKQVKNEMKRRENLFKDFEPKPAKDEAKS